jgi:glutathione-regulated potassium-efflux system ancillary protein KefC
MVGSEAFHFSAIQIIDVLPMGVAFLFGFGARLIGLPPLVGFLVAGFLLGAFGAESGEELQFIADLGVTLLLFTIGLKLNPRQLLHSAVWATASIHMLLLTVAVSALLFMLAMTALSLFAGMDYSVALLLGFAWSFSSTVFAVKALEENGELNSLHGRLAIAILIMQDLFAVVFIAFSAGKIPSPWALGLLLLIPARPLLLKLLEKAGHGELMVLLGWLMPLAAAGLFELAGVKADLGALFLGILLAGHPKTDELSKTLYGFKDLFLIGFFLTIGLTGAPTWELLGAALLVVALLPFKTALYFWLLTRFRLRARSAALASFSLANYSEFGLIVVSTGVVNGWLDSQWLTVIALSLSISFMLAAPANALGKSIYRRWRDQFKRFELAQRLPGDELIDTGDARVVVFGMGRVGSAAYDYLRQHQGDVVLGIDRDIAVVNGHRQQGRNIILGDATDYDFWSRARSQGDVKYALLTFPEHNANIAVARLIKEFGFNVSLASVAKFDDQIGKLQEAGVSQVFNLYAEAGAGFAEHVWERLRADGD